MAITNSRVLEALYKISKVETGSLEVIDLLKNLRSDEIDKNFLFVYGSLRKKQYNYERIRAAFGNDSLVYIATTEIKYATMYDMGSYPACTGGGYYTRVVGEVMYCSDEVFKAIKDMEEGAGYRKIDTHFYSDDNRTIFLPYYIAGRELLQQIYEYPEKFNHVESGDWCKYLMATKVEGE